MVLTEGLFVGLCHHISQEVCIGTGRHELEGVCEGRTALC